MKPKIIYPYFFKVCDRLDHGIPTLADIIKFWYLPFSTLLFTSYLSNLKQFLMFNRFKSIEYLASSGIPQDLYSSTFSLKKSVPVIHSWFKNILRNKIEWLCPTFYEPLLLWGMVYKQIHTQCFQKCNYYLNDLKLLLIWVLRYDIW